MPRPGSYQLSLGSLELGAQRYGMTAYRLNWKIQLSVLCEVINIVQNGTTYRNLNIAKITNLVHLFRDKSAYRSCQHF